MQVVALHRLPSVAPGDDLAGLVLAAARDQMDGGLAGGDVLVVASKALSRAEGRFVDLRRVAPSDRARALAAVSGGAPALVEVVLQESVGVSRVGPGALIVRHRLGHVCANAGVDRSNARPPVDEPGADWVITLPADPDGWAAEVVCRARPASIGVIVTDTVGRAFRVGPVGTAIGVAGLPAVVDLRGRPDRHGRTLEHTEAPLADILAAAADLVMGQADEGTPAAVVRGVAWTPVAGPGAGGLVRVPGQDLYA